VRVIGGQWRGRPLQAPAGRSTRPTSDRVREAIFDVLGSLLGADGLVGARVADLFAGSGALGIEALSRGASHAVLIDDDGRAVSTIRRNLARLGADLDGVTAEVVRADVVAWLAGPAAARRFDVAFADPPYAFDQWAVVLERLRADVVVVEADRPVELRPPWVARTLKRYGGTLVTVATSVAAPVGGQDTDGSTRRGRSSPGRSKQKGAP